MTNFESDPINYSFIRTITICYKDTENPSLAMNESVAPTNASKKEESSSATGTVALKKVPKETDGLEFLYEQLKKNSESDS